MNNTAHRLFRVVLKTAVLVGVVLLLSFQSNAYGQGTQPSVKEKPFAVEYYYKAKWGYADEFIRLYKKNHYPVMKKEMDMGRILRIAVEKPRYHATEDGRWDFKVTLVWKNVQVTEDGFDEENLIRQLFPDQETYKQEEQRRFEILLGHWDTPVVDVDLEK